MSDSTTDRKTEFWPSAVNLPMPGGYGAAATTTYYAGTMQTLDSSDRPKNPTTVTEKVIGVVVDHIDNSAGANDALKVNFRTGPHKFALHVTNPPVAGDVGKPGYASDNQTISKTASDGSIAGIILQVESDGVWIWVGPPATGSASLAGLTATALTDNSGGAAADGTIGAVTAPTAIAATLTDSTGGSGTHDDVLADGLTVTDPAGLTGTALGDLVATQNSGWGAATEAGFDSISTKFDALVVDVADIHAKLLLAIDDITVQNQNDSDLAQKVIELVAAQAQNRTAIVALQDAIKELSTKVNTIISDLA